MEYRLDQKTGYLYRNEAEHFEQVVFYIPIEKIKSDWNSLPIIEVGEDQDVDKLAETMLYLYKDENQSFFEKIKPYQIAYNIAMNKLSYKLHDDK